MRIRGQPKVAASSGFTLIESVIVILLIGILAAVAAVFIVAPFQASNDMIRRAELVNSTETALDRMTREIRLAVPNSIRVQDGGSTLELLRAPKGGRYRRLEEPDGGGDPLDRAQASDSFDVLGGLGSEVNLRDSGGRENCGDGQGDCIVIMNTGGSGFDAYSQDNIAAITGADDTSVPTNLTFNTGGEQPAFPSHSPNQRFQLVDTIVSYICDGSEIRRHFDYGLTGEPGDPNGLLAEDVEACEFSYDGGAGERHGLVTIDLTIQRDGETVRLVDQAHVVNVP